MQFSELKNVDLREAWPREDRDFTPWMSENLERLSRAIGIPLDLEGVEVAVEQFSADIIARNPADGSLVLIENQLQDTDHTHLGQILTYLAGLGTKTIIWIARGFQDAHLSAIRWLNENTTEPFSFFAVKVRIVRIGDDDSSPIAPLFEVLESPSEWDRMIRKYTQEPSEQKERLRRLRRGFWQFYAKQYPDDIQLNHDHKDSNVYHQIAGVTVSQYLAQKEVGVYVQEASESNLELARLVSIYEEALKNEGDGQGRLHRLKANSNDQSNWPEMAEWLHNTLLKFRQVLTEHQPEDEINVT